MNDNGNTTEVKLVTALVNGMNADGTFTPEFLARKFCNMYADEQAAFFQWIHVLSAKWDKHRGEQWCSMEEHMRPEALALMKEMVEHIEAMSEAA